jgi:hypothetical protein
MIRNYKSRNHHEVLLKHETWKKSCRRHSPARAAAELAPGSYTLVAWHEAAGETSAPVVVAAGATASRTMSLTADSRVPRRE